LEAYIVVNTEPSKVWTIVDCIREIEGVKQSHAVAGAYDAIAYAEFKKVEDLGRIIIDIQCIKGVTQTQTLLVIPPTLKETVK
jgi:DNA-binding Lrp family transcriptional regulator